jgi:hypothetical protein
MLLSPRVTSSDIDHLHKQLGEPGARVFVRSGDRDLLATVWVVGTGTVEAGARRTEVEIAVTPTGRFIVSRQTSRQDFEWEVVESRSAVCETPTDVYLWLLGDGSGKFGPASKAAWEGACAAVPSLGDMERYEHVE